MSTPVDVALPRSFDARYGEGLGLGLSLGGGGLFFVAWLLAYLHELGDQGVELGRAERVVGTSAGSLVAAALTGGRLGRLHAEISVLANVPALLGALAPASDLRPSQRRALELFGAAADADEKTVRAIGHGALAAVTPGPETMRRNVALVLGGRRWPSHALHISCVDTYSAERCIVTHAAGVPVPQAVAASSAVPGLFAPQPVGDRRCMDGGVSGTGTHLDVLAGARRVMVLALSDGSDVTEGMMTVAPESMHRELAALAATGTEALLRTPDEIVDRAELMAPEVIPKALAMGARQAAADAPALGRFWTTPSRGGPPAARATVRASAGGCAAGRRSSGDGWPARMGCRHWS